MPPSGPYLRAARPARRAMAYDEVAKGGVHRDDAKTVTVITSHVESLSPGESRENTAARWQETEVTPSEERDDAQVAERLIASVRKTDGLRVYGGSNPSLRIETYERRIVKEAVAQNFSSCSRRACSRF
jgi:hypothetical protein